MKDGLNLNCTFVLKNSYIEHMNIKPEQLQNNLSRDQCSIYFVFGAEILLVEQSLSLIKDSAKEQWIQ